MFEDNMSRYADIINLPRPRSNHKPMSMHDRAAQFSPFSALTGLDDELAETARIVDSKIEISEDRAADLDEKIQDKLCLYGGGDYELLFTAPSANEDKIMELSSTYAVKVSKIGKIKNGTLEILKHGKMYYQNVKSFEHF